jgi:hypothetical protein
MPKMRQPVRRSDPDFLDRSPPSKPRRESFAEIGANLGPDATKQDRGALVEGVDILQHRRLRRLAASSQAVRETTAIWRLAPMMRSRPNREGRLLTRSIHRFSNPMPHRRAVGAAMAPANRGESAR